MKKSTIYIIGLFTFMFSFSNMEAQISGNKIGVFDSFKDIGNTKIAGEAKYMLPAQSYSIKGSGANIWFKTDDFAFLSKTIEGDFIIQTQVKFIGEGFEEHRKTGVMIRSSEAPNAAMVALTVHGDGLTSFQYRTKDGEDVQEIKFEGISADVLQLEKKGNVYTAYVAAFGDLFSIEKITIDLGKSTVTGLFVCSHNNNYIEEVIFSNTRVFHTAPDDLVQYKDYLGSLLEVLAVETGTRNVVGSSADSWQAPNWTPDGKTLIYNSKGNLFNFDLETQKSSLLNTDFANKNNNDHILSFDGKQMGISHHSAEDGGKSIIYTLPVTGGTPTRITKKGPSYLHGWSPDNKYLIYTAERKGDFNIYRIPTSGGKEKKLTNTKALDDGSEYSPDGKYIYFNSSRTGTMQLWRMDADGKNQIQLTSDELNDWFPHVSPDNKWLVFISFPKELAADTHPFYERVYIRLMPIEGGEAKVIAYLYGGQGTLNVPSWSPDGKKIAFVSNGYFDKE